MRRRKKKSFPSKYILLIMTIFCLVIIFGSIRNVIPSGPVHTVVGYVIIPMQKGINKAGTALTEVRESLTSKKQLQEENSELRQQLDTLQAEMNQVQLNQQELDQLRELYQMDRDFADYEKAAASVIGKDSGNWFSTFLIDKGSNDGIAEGMNVIANGGLAGIVTEVGPNYATVRSVIDDNTNISCMDMSNNCLCIVSGSLKTMNESSRILFSDLSDSRDTPASPGDQIVTSNISDLYLEGIPVGYLTDVQDDPNHLTKSGTLATIADFEHMNSVFVILQTKGSTTEDGGSR